MLPLYRILGNFSFNLNYLSLYVFLLIDTRYVLLTVATTLAEIITLMVLLLMICYYNNNIIITAKVFQHLRKLVFLNRRTSSQIITLTMVNSHCSCKLGRGSTFAVRETASLGQQMLKVTVFWVLIASWARNLWYTCLCKSI